MVWKDCSYLESPVKGNFHAGFGEKYAETRSR